MCFSLISSFYNCFSPQMPVFHGRKAPEPATLVGYGSLIEGFHLAVPLPEQLTLISSKKRQSITEQWMVFTSCHKPDDTLYKHIVFALKYEGIQLLIFKKLFEQLSVNEVVELIQLEPLGQYCRRIWFLYEWLFQKKLPVVDLTSGNILNRIIDYQKVLEDYSRPLLDFIEWKETIDHNVEITNETIDYYRYFDATKQATFLYACVKETIDVIIPQEVDYLIRYEAFKNYLDNVFEMPDNMIALIVRFLTQNNGVLSKRAREMEFQELTNKEVKAIENKYSEVFSED